MVIIPEEYYTKERILKLTEAEIDDIINELKRVPHDLFEFQKYNLLIKKLKKQIKSN